MRWARPPPVTAPSWSSSRTAAASWNNVTGRLAAHIDNRTLRIPAKGGNLLHWRSRIKVASQTRDRPEVPTMARIVGGVAASHTPTIGFAYDQNKQDDPAWAPIFAAFKPVDDWFNEKKPDAIVYIF